MSGSVIDRVRAVIATTFGDPVGQVPADATFQALNLDSLDQVELVMAVEDHFDVRMSDGEGDALTGVADTARLVERKLAGKRDA